ncbi:hypothetical protein BDR26DRAFT_901042 [Obelidium mucronatum]|nr:hypothetical protein BDR26DRAFT_901042 [Obelidium mucronatum]
MKYATLVSLATLLLSLVTNAMPVDKTNNQRRLDLFDEGDNDGQIPLWAIQGASPVLQEQPPPTAEPTVKLPQEKLSPVVIVLAPAPLPPTFPKLPSIKSPLKLPATVVPQQPVPVAGLPMVLQPSPLNAGHHF